MKTGFTLIELLVVVLIIGILTAVAMPLYERAVWSARARLLQTAVRQLADAQERYVLENGVCASSFADLDISFDSFPYTSKGLTTVHFMLYALNPLSDNAVRGNDFFEIAIVGYGSNICWSAGRFKMGPWKGGQLAQPEGFVFPHYDYRTSKENLKTLYCSEGTAETSNFCQQLTASPSSEAIAFQNARLYTL